MIEDEREAVPFGIASRGVSVGVDVDVLDEGLVVLPRESRGTAGEVPEHAPAGAAADRPMRLLIEQVSAVEHAYVAGVPVLGPGGLPMLTAGNGRPLVVCTLELPEAMRVLGGANRTRAACAAALLAAGSLLLVAALGLVLAGPVLAGPVLAGDRASVGSRVVVVRAAPSAEQAVPPRAVPAAAAAAPGTQLASAAPSPQPAASVETVAGGDTRSSGTPPSFVGQPVLAAVAVVLLGVVVAGVATIYVRLTQTRP